MALLDRLLPAWRHSDPEVRAAAVRELGRDARDALASVARSHGEVRVRRIAIKKIDDPELLLEIARTDADEELRALASARAEDLLVARAISRQPSEECARALAGLSRPSHRAMVAVRAFHPSVRRAALSSVSEQRSLAQIARRSDDPHISLDALERVTDVTLLRRIATGETRPEVALAALARIDDPGLLLGLAEDPQAQKSVRRRARAMLDLILTDDHPIRVAERRERQIQLCVSVERLSGEPDPAAGLAALQQAESNWRDLGARAAADPELEERFRRACHVVGEAIARAEERALKEEQREAARGRACAARQHLCETVEGLEGPEAPERLTAARSAWRALEPSNDPRCDELAVRFAQAVGRCEQRHERWRVREAFHSQLEALVLEAERLVAAGDPRAAARPRAALETRWAQLQSSPEGTKWLASERALQRRFAEAGAALSTQVQALRSERQQRERAACAQLKGLCARLEQLAQADTVRRAVADRAVGAAADALRHFPALPASEREVLRQRLAAAQQTLAQRVEEKAIAERWRRWANADVQQKLIERAEVLLAAGDPRQMLREIGQLERDWQRVAVAPRDQSQALWERFRVARDQLRRVRDAYLSDNIAKKEALCVAVEQLADSTDWNATAAAIRRMQAEWKQIGPVREQVSAALFERFRAPANRFFDRRKQLLLADKERREERLGRLRELCEAAEALADSTDWEVTALEIKRLQAAARDVWGRRRTPVQPQLGGEGQTEGLRHRFQLACDRFFDRYRRRDELELEATLAAAETILADLESLRVSVTGADAPPVQDVATRLKDRLAEWRRLGTIPPDRANTLHQRLLATCDAIETAYPDGLPEAVLAAESNVQQREKLCLRLERLVTSLTASVDEPSPRDLAERLQLALAANTIGGLAATPHEQALRAAAETAERLQEKWQRLGPVIGHRARVLSLRFDKASADLNALRGAPNVVQGAR
jgi:hypothetical protein